MIIIVIKIKFIYVICMSGVVYNILHNVPFTTVNDKGEVIWYNDDVIIFFKLL